MAELERFRQHGARETSLPVYRRGSAQWILRFHFLSVNSTDEVRIVDRAYRPLFPDSHRIVIVHHSLTLRV